MDEQFWIDMAPVIIGVIFLLISKRIRP